MADIHVAIAGRSYRMACDDGQEDHLRALAARLDLKIAEMRVRFGEIGDQRIAIMAALTLADEADDAERRAAALEGELKELRGATLDSDTRAEDHAEAIATALTAVARRIERITHGIEVRPKRSD